MNEPCPCTAYHTNLGCQKHARPYLLSFHRASPNPVIRLEILARAFAYEDFWGTWPNFLYMTRAQFDELIGLLRDADDVREDPLTQTRSFLGMEIEFIPRGELRVGYTSLE